MSDDHLDVVFFYGVRTKHPLNRLLRMLGHPEHVVVVVDGAAVDVTFGGVRFWPERRLRMYPADRHHIVRVLCRRVPDIDWLESQTARTPLWAAYRLVRMFWPSAPVPSGSCCVACVWRVLMAAGSVSGPTPRLPGDLLDRLVSQSAAQRDGRGSK